MSTEESELPFDFRRTEITKFKVFARVRPFIDEELSEMRERAAEEEGASPKRKTSARNIKIELRSVIEMINNKTILLDPKENYTPVKEFEFDDSFWSIPPTQKLARTFQDSKHGKPELFNSQRQVFERVAKGCADDAFNGYNSCVMTYGQTGSGKTYTMMGKYYIHAVHGEDGEEGIIPRVCHDLFTILKAKEKEQDGKKTSDRTTFRVEVNFVEIYMEKVRDLLDPSLERGKEVMTDARIRQDPCSGPFVEGVTKYRVENWGHCCTLLERGSRHRTTCATAVHNQSSRSHAIFQLTIIQQTKRPAVDRYSAPTMDVKAARINLVDLAGSERGGFQDYVKESAQINKSLLALRRVIDNLTERQTIMMQIARLHVEGKDTSALERTLPQVPFRDSVLTWLLSDSIGGNARTTMVATVSPMAKNYNDTLATLMWSSRARSLVTVVKQNDAQTGIENKIGALNASLAMRQQTVDSLRGLMEQQKKEANKLEQECDIMAAKLAKSKAASEAAYVDGQLIRFQKVARDWAAQRFVEDEEEELEEEEAKLKQSRQTLEKQRARIEEYDEELQSLKEEAKEVKRQVNEAKEELREKKSNRKEFFKRKAEVEARYVETQSQLNDNEAAIRRDATDLEHKLVEAQAEREASAKQNQKMKTQVDALKEDLNKKTASEWKATYQQIDHEKIRPLRDKLADLLVQKGRLLERKERLLKMHAKAYPDRR